MGEHRILFVCLNNTSRSPLAEEVFRHVVAGQNRLDEFLIDSAGTGRWQVGEPPNKHVRQLANARGFDISGRRSRRITSEDFGQFDVILAMDRANREHLRQIAPPAARDKVHLLTDFAEFGHPDDVPDPRREGSDSIDRLIQVVAEAGHGLLQQIDQLLGSSSAELSRSGSPAASSL
jgi:protein-tyrosine phosphatase